MSLPSPLRSRTIAEALLELRRYLTLDYMIPVALCLSFIIFILLEWAIPELRDALAFQWDMPPGVVEKDPVQSPPQLRPLVFRGAYGLYTHKRTYYLEPLHHYEIEARVLHKRHYYSDKNSADLIPFDLGLGWRVMSDAEILRRYFTFHHYNYGGRILWTMPAKDMPYSLYEEVTGGLHLSNNHLVPASEEIYDTIRKMKAGDFVLLKGELVDITRPDLPGWRWITSKYARDNPNKGNGFSSGDAQVHLTTCDTLLVTEATILTEP